MSTTTEINGYEITTGTVLRSTCSDQRGALDVDVQVVTPDGAIISGEVTLLPDPGNGDRYGMWGEGLHHWATQNLHDLPREVTDEIAAVAGARCDESDLAA